MNARTFSATHRVTVAQVGLESTITDTETGVETLDFSAIVSIECGDSWLRRRIEASIVRRSGKLQPPGQADGELLRDVTLHQLHDLLGPILYWSLAEEIMGLIHEAGIKQFGGDA